MYDYVLEEMADAIAKEFHIDNNDALRVLSRYWQDKIAQVWQVDDMLECALNAGKPITHADAMEVLQDVFNNCDSSIGINWTSLEVELENYQLEFKTLPLDQWKEVYGVFAVRREGETGTHEFGAFPDHVKGNLNKALEYARTLAIQKSDVPVFVTCCSQINIENAPWLTVIQPSGADEPSILESEAICTPSNPDNASAS